MDIFLNALEQVSALNVLIATVVTFLFGWAWHSPLLFMDQWMKVNNMPNTKPDPKDMMMSMGKGVLNTALINTMMATLLVLAGTNSLKEALTVGLVAWVGLSLYEGLGGMIWMKKSCTSVWVNAGHTLGVVVIGICVMTLL